MDQLIVRDLPTVYFNSRYIDAVKHGTFKIGTSAEFRVEDGHVDGRGDPLELQIEWEPPLGVIELDRDHAFIRAMGQGDKPGGHWPIRMNNEGARFILNTAAYLFCLSKNDTLQRRKLMNDKFDHNALYYITDLEKFGLELTRADPRLSLPVLVNFVSYKEIERPYRAAVPIFEPLTKRPQFSWQNEIRFVWRPEGSDSAPFLLNAPQALKHMTPPRLFIY